jgi:hypothetical protein
MKDTLGRENRKLPDVTCPVCGKTFRPLRAASRYCSNPCARSKNGGHNKKPESWWRNKKGYIEGKIWLDCGTQIRVKQHRFIVEGILGRPLAPDEDVHHKNGVKNDNQPGNLEIISHSAHSRLSNANREYAKGYSLNLSQEERKARSLRAIASRLAAMGCAAIAKAEGRAE